MSTLTKRDVEHIFEALRKGIVPERGIDAFAVGIEKQRGEIHRQLELAEDGEGTVKFLRGGYGSGKTFMARLAVLDAQARGFATSFVVVSDNDLRLHRFDDVYQKVMTELGTASCPRGALGDILDRWMAAAEMGTTRGAGRTAARPGPAASCGCVPTRKSHRNPSRRNCAVLGEWPATTLRQERVPR
jgi:hypothetical protein